MNKPEVHDHLSHQVFKAVSSLLMQLQQRMLSAKIEGESIANAKEVNVIIEDATLAALAHIFKDSANETPPDPD